MLRRFLKAIVWLCLCVSSSLLYLHGLNAGLLSMYEYLKPPSNGLTDLIRDLPAPLVLVDPHILDLKDVSHISINLKTATHITFAIQGNHSVSPAGFHMSTIYDSAKLPVQILLTSAKLFVRIILL